MKIPDQDCIKLMKMLTFLDLEIIEEYERQQSQGLLEPNALQKIIAREMTLFVHGEEGVQVAERVTQAASFGKEMTLDYHTLLKIADEFPKKELLVSDVLNQKYTEVAVKTGLCSSKSEAARLIKNQGAYLNNQRLDQVDYCINEQDLIGNRFLLIGSGKKIKLLVEIKTH